jgi:hypothetical protein
LALEKGGRRIRADRGPEPMNQLPHAPVGIAEFVSDVILGEAIDEDGAQRLVLAVIGCGVGLQEEPSATEVVHGCTLECEVVFRDWLLSRVVSKREPQAKPDGTEDFRNEGKPRVLSGRSAE